VLELQKVDSNVQGFIDGVGQLCNALGSSFLAASCVTDLLNDTELSTLNVHELFQHLADFAENMQSQLRELVVLPMAQYQQAVSKAIRQARVFDEEAEGLDAAQLKYLALPRDSPLETRAYAQQDLDDRAATVALSLFDARCALQDACSEQRTVPQRTVGEMLVSQLAYHQSCTRLLSGAMPQVNALLSDAEQRGTSLAVQQEADAKERAAMPRPEQRTAGAPLAEGWLCKGAFGLLQAEKKAHLARLKPWHKRWFVLCEDGKLFYYKGPEDAVTALKVPLNMNLVQSVSVVNGPLEFELRMGPRTLRLKATDPTERARWMEALNNYLDTHTEARAAAAASNRRRFIAQGLGIRDLDGFASTHSRTSISGFLHRQDMDIMRRWRKWWCTVENGELKSVLFEQLRISDPHPREARVTRGSTREKGTFRGGTIAETHSAASAGSPAASSSGGSGNGATGSLAFLSTSTSTAVVRSTSTGSRDSPEAKARPVTPLPFRVMQTVQLPLATVTVREARQAAVSFCFEVISPQGSLLLQAISQEEMQLWMQTIQNGTAELLGSLTRMSTRALENTTLGVLRAVDGNALCADCGAAHPTWASINLGVIVCLACAGVHRQLGVHISKVRSLELDTKEWSAPLVSLMLALGNERLNTIWQPTLPAEQAIKSDAGNAQREAFIRKKYEAREFVSDEGPAPSDASLFTAALSDDVFIAAECLARGVAVDVTAPAVATAEWSGEAAALHGHRGALHVCAACGSEGVLELLLQNAAPVDAEEPSGKTPLRLAVDAAEAGCVLQLLTRGANISYADHAGQTPMQAALEHGHEDLQQLMLDYKLAQDEKLLEQSMKQ